MFDQLDLVTYEEVVKLPSFKRKTLVLLGKSIFAQVFCIYTKVLHKASVFFPQSIFIPIALESKLSKRFTESQGLTPNKQQLPFNSKKSWGEET